MTIELIHLQKAFEDATPLRDVNVTIREGDVISVIGPSGTGKSTLLRCLNLLDPPTGGEIRMDGECITKKGCNVPALRRRIGMVFQSFNLFADLTAVENVMTPQIELLGRSRKEAYERAAELLRQVGLSDKAFSYPDELSGGQKQRVAIARTLAMDPEVILFDEPTSALDPTMVREVEVVIENLAKMGKTMLIVTHEMRFARSIANRVFYMDDGGVYEDGTPEQIFEEPQKERTRRFILGTRLLELSVPVRNYDYPETVAKTEAFCLSRRLGAEAANRLVSVFEELCQQILMSVLPEGETVRFSAEHRRKDGRLAVSVQYGGERFDPRNADDTIALSILESNIEAAEFSCVDNINEFRFLCR